MPTTRPRSHRLSITAMPIRATRSLAGSAGRAISIFTAPASAVSGNSSWSAPRLRAEDVPCRAVDAVARPRRKRLADLASDRAEVSDAEGGVVGSQAGELDGAEGRAALLDVAVGQRGVLRAHLPETRQAQPGLGA